jgi:hypothetical protein
MLYPTIRLGILGLIFLTMPMVVLVGCGAAPEANPLMADGTTIAADMQATADTSGSDTGGAEQSTPPADAGQPVAGDMNGNGVVDQADENAYRDGFQTAFGSSTGNANYDPSLDMNGDGVVSWTDLQAFLALAGG